MRQFICTCKNHNGGYPHGVPEQTFYRHLRQAGTEDRQRIRDRKGLTLRDAINLYLSDQQNASGSSSNARQTENDADNPNPPQAKRAKLHADIDSIGDEDTAQERVSSPSEDPPDGPPTTDVPPSPGAPSPSNDRSERSTNDDQFPEFDLDMGGNSPLPEENSEENDLDHDNQNDNPNLQEQDARGRDSNPPEGNSGQLGSPSPSPSPAPQDRQPRRVIYNRRRPPPFDLDALSGSIALLKLQETMDLVMVVKNARLEDPIAKMTPAMITKLRNPQCVPLVIENLGVRHSIQSYLSLEHASQRAYDGIIASTRANFPDARDVDGCLSFKSVESFLAMHTGVEHVFHDMCPGSCVAFTGPYTHLDKCPMCPRSRWNEEILRESGGQKKVPAKRFPTIFIGPQLQARYRDPKSAQDMAWLRKKTADVMEEFQRTRKIAVIEDIAMGSDYLGAVMDGDINPDDIVLMVSLDGAQLYEDKESDCWMYIWIVLNLSPEQRYRKYQVLPGGFFPGPNKPKNLDSFLAVGLHHLAAIQHEGLQIYDSHRGISFRSNPYLLYPTADGPGLVYWDGLVGHSGKNGCRIYCGALGRRKPGQSHYYPALSKPDRACAGSDHPDYHAAALPTTGPNQYALNLPILLSSRNQAQFDARRLETGITKPPLLLGLPPTRSLGVPNCLTTDIMHLIGNMSELLLLLWRGDLKCAPTDHIETWDWAIFRDNDVWKEHGRFVDAAGSYLPGSFDVRPRDISEKLNTGYKTREFQIYMFGLAPGLLLNVLPLKYWRNFCKLVRGFQILCQHCISYEDVRTAHTLLAEWGSEFEDLYYQRRADRLQFIRPCVHQVLHLAAETIRKGPPVCYAQWTMERTIGIIKTDMRQASNYQANFMQQGIRLAYINALLSALPTLKPDTPLPRGSADLGNGYVLLRKRDKNFLDPPHQSHVVALQEFMGPDYVVGRIKRWARLLLPNGQIARCAWRENLIPTDKLRISRMVKFHLNGKVRVGEVLYFTRISQAMEHVEDAGGANNAWQFSNIALVHLFSLPDEDLLQLSYNAVPSCVQLHLIHAIRVQDIISVIAMVPYKRQVQDRLEDHFFMVEKPGLDLACFAGVVQAGEDGDDAENTGDVE